MKSFQELNPESKVWVYQSDRFFLPSELDLINIETKQFLNTWQSHGATMDSSFKIFYNRFLVIALDETIAGASGCGIDKSVNFIKELGNKLQIDFFNRLNICYVSQKTNGSELFVEQIPFSKISEINFNGNEYIFNNAVTTLSELEKNWLQPISDSWLAKHITASLS
jgi:hypothetical protein